MSITVLQALPTYPAGVYRLVSRTRPGPILATITEFGWYAAYIDGRLVLDKETFLLAAGQALGFPAYYGRNWDAFEEMVNDLAWLGLDSMGDAAHYTADTGGHAQYRGCAILYDYAHRFAASQPAAWQTALAIMQGAAQRWQQEGVPFYLLLRHNRHFNRQVPRLVA